MLAVVSTPTTIHGDTQAQSTPVFGLAYLLGIKLMPRIRNWKDLRFFRLSKDTRYRHIDNLFSETIDWDLIETHWQDLLQVVLSVKAGTVSSALLLRRLGTYSRRNRLYQAFSELGRVIRTAFLLEYLSSAQLREQITASTNKVEAYHRFAKWLFFGGEGLLLEVHPDEQEKRLKYNHLLTNAVAIQNVIDLTRAVRQLMAEGYPVKREDLAALSPYQTPTHQALRRLRVHRDCARTIRRRSGHTISAGSRIRGAVRHRLTLWPTFTRISAAPVPGSPGGSRPTKAIEHRKRSRRSSRRPRASIASATMDSGAAISGPRDGLALVPTTRGSLEARHHHRDQADDRYGLAVPLLAEARLRCSLPPYRARRTSDWPS